MTANTQRIISQATIRQQLASRIFDQSQEGIMITDANGIIVDVNEAFVRITGYTKEETIGHDTRILRSGAQDKAFYETMWSAIREHNYWKGEIWNRKKSGEMYPELLSISAVRNDRGDVENYVAIFLDISEIKEKENELRRLAFFDPLTDLPNRTLAMDRLRQNMSRLKRNRQLLAVAYIDLDGFKEINDLLGHHAGDIVLIEMARRMKTVLRGGDTISRLGGDEFLAMITDLRSSDDIEAFINRFFQSIRRPVEIEGKSYRLSASLGVTFYPQRQEIDAELLIRQADQAMYQAKIAGKDQYYVFDSDIETFSRGRQTLIQQIRDGLRRAEFELYFQPKINMRTGTVIGVESLLRWHHPEMGLLEPISFLPKVVGHEIEIELGWWCIDTALTQLSSWALQGKPLPISVNISALHLQQPQFVDALRARLERYPAVTANSLELEILETSALTDLHRVGQLINECAKIGVQFSVDDFGTGYSTLLMLRHLPAQFLKIDRSFVQNLLTESNDLVLMESMITLGQAFGRRVIAEGVETELQSELLLRLGCELAQGYCIARPMPLAELESWRRTWQPPSQWQKARKFNTSEFEVLQRVIQHGIWIQGLERFLSGDVSLQPELESHHCDFERVLNDIGVRTEQSRRIAAELIATHKKIHALAATIQIAIESQRQSDSDATLAELKQLGGRLLQIWFDLADSIGSDH